MAAEEAKLNRLLMYMLHLILLRNTTTSLGLEATLLHSVPYSSTHVSPLLITNYNTNPFTMLPTNAQRTIDYTCAMPTTDGLSRKCGSTASSRADDCGLDPPLPQPSLPCVTLSPRVALANASPIVGAVSQLPSAAPATNRRLSTLANPARSIAASGSLVR